MRKHTSRARRAVTRRQFHVRWLLLAVTALLLAGKAPGPDPVAVAQSTVDCQPGDSRVACENRQTQGVTPQSQWDIAGIGDANLQGFATDISVARGGAVRFKIDSTGAYRIRIYRLGYYGGQGARRMASIPAEIEGEPLPAPLPTQDQPDCLAPADGTGLVDCGNWVESASWAVPQTAVSGIYLARLEREAPAGASHIVFIVRDDVVDPVTGDLITPAQSDLLFQTSDTTWQAYNPFGGNSLYAGGPGTNPNRAYKVSYNRPFTTRELSPKDWVFDAEYPMVRWVERNGYDVSYVAGVDTDRLGTQLFASPLRHKVLLSVGHDEYWSGQQRTNVEAARSAGMHLAFFSGNEVFWKTRWENSVLTDNAAYRTLVSYKETHAGAKIDVGNPWTGTWRDSRSINPEGGQPENALTGQIFVAKDGAMDFAIEVPQADGLLRLWRNTTVAELAQGETATLAAGTLGNEWDHDADNGARPPGLFRLSSTTKSAPLLTDEGSTYVIGNATHSLTMYRHASNALVFGAGTVQWPWGLDGTHDRGGPEGGVCTESTCPGDVRMQQATMNLFADMGVQPVTRQANLTAALASTDTTPPTSTITFPAAGAYLQLGIPITITGTATDTGGGLVGGVEVSVDGGATWHPAAGRQAWTYAWTSTAAGPVTFRSRAVDDSGRLETPSAGVNASVLTETVPPAVVSVEPINGTFGVALGVRAVVTFTEQMNAESINGTTFELKTPSNVVVPAIISYDADSLRAFLKPSAPLSPSTTYTARVRGGAGGITDVAGNPLVSDTVWSFTTGAATTGSPTDGPGGPVLVITSSANPFTTYYAEILRTEGLNAFAVADIDSVTGGMLGGYDVVILGEMALSPAQATMFSDWVTLGGNLVAMRPDADLYSLLGLTNTGTTLANAYLQIDTSSGPGAGLVSQTIQFHGLADRATLIAGAGAVSLATLYATDTVATTNPAVTLRSVGSNGGQAAAFLFDLARSVVYTRQGNPAWTGQERDGFAPIRSDDLFYGPSTSDPQNDWVDLNKVAIPQADEQQRLLANLVLDVSADRKPLPRFWYFPRGEKAVIVMTGDDHRNGGTAGRFTQYKSFGPPGCSVSDWECVRSSSYVYPGTGFAPGQAAAFDADGFEIGLHVNPGGVNTMTCGEWTAANLPTVYASQLADFAASYPDLPAPTTTRTHCISWGPWAAQAITERSHGIRLDTNYYFWPGNWVQNRPGMFTGSGMPMRFADLDGTMIDVYQATTQMTDESGQVYPATVNALLDSAIGPLGYYGAFTANMHTDADIIPDSNQIVASANPRGVPIVSARQMLTWIDARNASSFSTIAWDAGTQVLTFGISVAAGANGLEAMLPLRSGTRALSALTRDGAPVNPRTERIKGVDYVIFAARPGTYAATYPGDSEGPVISEVAVTPTGASSALVTWNTNEPATSEVLYGLSPSALNSSVSDPALRLNHSMTITGLTPSTTYHFLVKSRDSSGNESTASAAGGETFTFTTPSLTLVDTTVADFTAGTPGAGTYISESINGEVMLAPTVGTEFSGTALPAGWEVFQWQTGGVATVADGVLTVDGARVNPTAIFGPGRSLEFSATFKSEMFQHSGWGVTFDDAPFAIFSTNNSTGQLFARTVSGAGSFLTPLSGLLVNVPHRFRIDWNAATPPETGQTVAFYIDGSLVVTHPISALEMRPIAASDFNFACCNIVVNWLRMGPYAASSTFDSRILDAGDPSAAWGAISWLTTTPAGTSVNISVRAGSTATPDASWTPFAPVPASGTDVGLEGRYLQYRAELATTDLQRSPELLEVTAGYAANVPPEAGNDAYSTPRNQTLTIAAPGVLANDADANGDGLTAELVSAPSRGTLALNPNGAFTYTAQAGFVGTDTFQYVARDANLPSNVATVTITVFNVNVAPVAAGESYSTTEDIPLTVSAPGVLANDSDGDNDPLVAVIAQPPAHGSLVLNADGSFTYTPQANYAGPDTFDYTANDGTLASNVATVTITVTAVNDGPVASNDSYSVAEDGVLTIAVPGVLGNDSDADSDPLTAALASGPANGTSSLASNGSFTYTPNPNFNGTDSFTYTVSDGVLSSVGTVTITVTSVNDVPVAVNDAYTLDEDGALLVPGAGVLANDSDLDNGTLTAALVTGPANGALTLNPSGSFVYTPAPEFSGTDSFTYRANDGSANSNIATVTLTIAAVNDPPAAGNDSYATLEDQPLTIVAPGVLANDTDVEGAALTAILTGTPLNGIVGLNPDGSFTYTPNPNFSGIDAFTYRAFDGSTASPVATVSITTQAVNDAPVGVADSYGADKNIPLTVAAPGVLANDTDVDGPALSAAVETAPANGTLVLNADGSFTYTPALDYVGGDTFTYRASDGTLASTPTTVSIVVFAERVVVQDAAAGSSVSTDLNDGEAGATSLDALETSVTLSETTSGAVSVGETSQIAPNPADHTFLDYQANITAPTATATEPLVLTFTLDASIIPEGENENTLDVFRNGQLVADCAGGSGTSATPDPCVADRTLLESGDVEFTVFTSAASQWNFAKPNANVAAVANADSHSTNEDTVLTVAALGVLGNDTDADGNTLRAIVATGPANGSLTLLSTGGFTYTPNADFNGTDSFSYRAHDGRISSNLATVTIVVNPVNDGPTAVADTAATSEETAVDVEVIANDTDIDSANATLSVAAGSIGNLRGGTAEILADGRTVRFTPALNANSDNTAGGFGFTYRVTDGTIVSSNEATATITVSAVNDAPTAEADSYTTAEDTALTIAAPGLLGNDTDPEGASLTAIGITLPANGTLALNADGSFTYTPPTNFNGTDTFTYRVSDGTAQSGPATVTITVTSVNDAPVANGQAISTNEDVAAPITLAATDVDGDPLTFSIVAAPSHGTLSGTAPNLTYTPALNYNGPDSFTFKANDGTADSNVATVTITIAAVNDAPVAANQSVTTNEDVAATIALGANDVDGDSLTFSIVAGPSQGTLTGTAPNMIYTPNANYNGADSFTFSASDGTLTSNIATVSITVTPVNDAPVASNQSVTTNEDIAAAVTLGGTDIDGDTLTYTIVSGPSSGTLSGTAPNLTYTPALNYNGTDSFTFKATDASLDSNIATVSITVTAVNDAPVAASQAVTTNEDVAAAITLAGSDADGDPLTFSIVAPPSRGTLTGTAPNLTYTPALNYNGADSFTFKVNDGSGDSNIATVSITVTAVNDTPVAQDQVVTTNEDVAAAITLGATDVDGDPLTYSIVIVPSRGTLSGTAPNLTYTPALNSSGTDSFTFKVNDGTVDSNIATVSITVAAVNDAPVAVADTATVNEDSGANSIDVRANDTDVEGDTLAVAAVTQGAHGAVAIGAGGAAVTYTPAANYAGPDAFTYTVSDGNGGSATASVSVTVTQVNDAPQAGDRSYTTNEDTPLAVDAANGILAGGSDLENDPLTATLVSTTQRGTLVFNANGSFTYTPNADFAGTDSFTYRVNDGALDSNLGTATIVVQAINDAPIANPDAATTNEDAAADIVVVANDTDVDTAAADLRVAADSIANVRGGSAVVLADGRTVRFTPALNANSDNTAGGFGFTYMAHDGAASSNVATVTITVQAVNDAPAAVADSYSTDEDTSLTVNAPGVLGNDSDVEADALTAVRVSGPSNGTLTLNANGSFVYTPNQNFNGSDSFAYTANDGTGASSPAVVTITVNPINDAPTATDDSYTLNEDATLTVGAPGTLSNDADVDGTPLTAVAVTGPAHGTLVLNADGSFTYTPAADFFGIDAFTYRVSDGSLQSVPATVQIAVIGVNDPPTAVADSATTNEDVAVDIDVVLNDTDLETPNSALQVSPSSLVSVRGGTAVLINSRTVRFTPNANAHDANTPGGFGFSYILSDGELTATANVTISVTAVNDAPAAGNDSYSTNEDTALTVPAPGVLANDSDADGDAVTAIVVSAPANGSLTLGATGGFTYTPNANFHGADTFTYRANDGVASSVPATVTITVNAVNDTPVANGDSYSTDEDAALTVSAPGVVGNDTDADADTLSAVVVTGPSQGTLALNANGSFTYTPAGNYDGPDSFTYKVNDGTVDSNVATVALTINAVNDVPTAVNDSFTTDEDLTLTVAVPGVLGNDTDVDSSSLTASLVAGPTSGTLSLNANGSFSYTPNGNFNGSDSFTYRAADNQGPSNVATVTITINAVNDAPTAAADAYVASEDTTLTVAAPGVLSNDLDAEGSPLSATLVAGPAHGTLAFNADGSFTYTPALNYAGPDSFTYTVSDGLLASNVATVAITVTAANDAPVAAGDSYGTTEDTALTVPAPGVLGNDSDADGDALSAILVAGPSQGTLTLNPNGSFTYTPALNYAGPDSFTYKVSDGPAESNVATVAIAITAVNDAPVADGDSYTTAEDTALTVAVPGVLGNDSDAEGDALSAILVAGPSQGTLTLNPNGSFTYTPALNYAGPDSFTYKVSDGPAESNVATVAITVTAANDAPVAAGDSYSTAEDTALTVLAPGVLGNDSDADGDSLSAILATGPTHGTLALNANGSFTYTPALNYAGPDSFTYTVRDGTAESSAATVTMTVTAANDAPVAVDDSYSTAEDTALVVAAPGLLGNDTDVEGNALSAILVSGPSNGTLTLNANGSFTYTPALNYAGPDSFTYKVTDGTAESNIATVSITNTGANDAPAAANDSYSTTEDTALTVSAPGVLGNDSDADGDTLSAILVSGPSQGTLTLNANGSFTYTPAANYAGPDSFSYKASDGTAESAAATVAITVTAANDAPTAGNDSYTTGEDTPLVVAAPGVLGNDNDADSATITAVLVTGPGNGTLLLNADGSFTYTPNADFNGSDSFTYRATDGSAESNIATVSITITEVNDAPVAGNDSYATDEEATLTIAAPGVLGNDTDTEGATLTAVLVTGPADGTLVLNPNGSFTYTPNANFSGSDSFTYRANDGSANSGVSTVSITVNPVNDAPVAVNDSHSTNEDTALTVSAPGVLGNDSDVDGDTLSASLVAGPAQGTLTLNANGSFTYTPQANYAGADSFTYRASDGTAQSNVATVAITVTAVNDAPAAVNDSYTTAQGTTLTTLAPGVLGNDTDVDSGTLTAAVLTGALNGTVTLDANGSFTYVPNPSFSGTDTFTYRASDGTLQSNVATVSIVVTPGNQAPVAANDTYTTDEDVALNVSAPGVLGNDTDENGDPLTAAVVSGPSNGTLTLNANGSFTYTPNANFNGSDSFTYQASDASLQSNIATVAITITAVNDNPTAVNDSKSVMQDSAATAIAVLANDSSIEAGETLTISAVTQGANGSVAITGGGTGLTYAPTAGYSGADSFTYTIGDGNGGSATATVAITVVAKPSITINNVSVVEGNSGTTDADFNVTLSNASLVPVTVNYATVNGFARAGIDFIAKSGTLTFAAGDTLQQVTIKVIGETTKEKNETFAVRLSAATNATIARTDGIGTILDDDATPTSSMSSTSTREGNESTSGALMMGSSSFSLASEGSTNAAVTEGALTFEIRLTNASEIPISVDYVAVDLTGKAGVDFVPTAGTLFFAEDETVKYITVPVIGNNLHQANRRLTLRLSNPVELILENTEASGDIEDDDPAPPITISDAVVVEGNDGTSSAVFTVTLANESGKPEMVRYATADGTAAAGSDYTAVTGELTFEAGVTSKMITVPVIADRTSESNETFMLNLTAGSDAPLSRSQGIGTITDDDLAFETWTTTTAADFSTGTAASGAAVTNIEGGEVTLAAATGYELAGTALPTGWSGSVSKGGAYSVSGGWLSVDGGSVSAPLYGVNTLAEFSVTFAAGATTLVGVPNQFAGFVNAQFITKADGRLYARTSTSMGILETPIVLPAYGSTYRFGVRWTSTGAQYFLEGAQVASHTGSILLSQMNVRFGDSTVGGAKLMVDWMRVGPTAGVYTSRTFDAGQMVSWTGAYTTTQVPLPVGAGVNVMLRTSADGAAWTTWMTPAVVATAGPSRYVQYRLELTTTSASEPAPIVKDVAIRYER